MTCFKISQLASRSINVMVAHAEYFYIFHEIIENKCFFQIEIKSYLPMHQRGQTKNIVIHHNGCY